MKKLAIATVLAASAALFVPTAASAQDAWPVDPGDYVDVGMIKVDDGHSLEYANFLAQSWRQAQDFAKSKGWISDYQIWVNEYPRDGEPDIYLVTWFPNFADSAEDQRRYAAYLAHMKKTEQQLQSESGKRADYRHQLGGMLFRVQEWKK